MSYGAPTFEDMGNNMINGMRSILIALVFLAMSITSMGVLYLLYG